MADKKGPQGSHEGASASHNVLWKAAKSKDECCCETYIEEAVWISCETCLQWYHVQCVKLKGLTEEMVAKIERYECPFCAVSAVMYQKLDNSEQVKSLFHSAIKEEFIIVKDELRDAVKEAVTIAVKETTPSVVSGVVKETTSYAAKLESNLNVAASQQMVEEVTRRMDSDKIEREKRRLNVVIMKVPESKAPSAEQRRADDIRYCHEELEMKKEDIQKVWRAGKKEADSDDYCRPLIIQLVNESAVDYWTDGGKGYKTESGVWINKDLCKADRKANFLARSERRKRLTQVTKTSPVAVV